MLLAHTASSLEYWRMSIDRLDGWRHVMTHETMTYVLATVNPSGATLRENMQTAKVVVYLGSFAVNKIGAAKHSYALTHFVNNRCAGHRLMT